MQKKSGSKVVVILIVVALVALAILSTVVKKGPKKNTDGKGKQMPEIVLLYNTSESHKIIAEAMQEMWKNELGVDIQLVNKEWKVYLKDTQSLNYNIGRAGWIGDYNDPMTFLDMWVTDGGNNQTGWSKEWYDKKIQEATSEVDPVKRAKMLADAEDFLVNKELPILPIYFYVNSNVLKPYVKGMAFNLRDLHPLKEVYIEKGGKPAPPDKQVFTYDNGDEPETIDPAMMTGNIEFNIAQQIFEGLVVNDAVDLSPKPGVATSWEMSKDGLTYTFHLRKNAKWTNGDPVTAHDFVYSWKRALDPNTAADYAYMLFYLKNGRAFNEGKVKDFAKVGVKAVDDYTLLVTLEHPTVYFLDLVAFHTLLPVNRKCVEKFSDKWTRAENIVTNGPFTLTSWKPKEIIALAKSPTYWDAGKVKLQKINVSPINDNITSLRRFEAGETEWVRTVPLPQIDQWKKRSEAHFSPFLAVYYYRFNVTKPPFDDVRVRQAFNLAIDKKLICDRIMKAGQKPATHFVPPGITGYKSPKGPDYDPEKARQLLREAGYAVNVDKK